MNKRVHISLNEKLTHEITSLTKLFIHGVRDINEVVCSPHSCIRSPAQSAHPTPPHPQTHPTCIEYEVHDKHWQALRPSENFHWLASETRWEVYEVMWDVGWCRMLGILDDVGCWRFWMMLYVGWCRMLEILDDVICWMMSDVGDFGWCYMLGDVGCWGFWMMLHVGWCRMLGDVGCWGCWVEAWLGDLSDLRCFLLLFSRSTHVDVCSLYCRQRQLM
jgi:hypothetical protein